MFKRAWEKIKSISYEWLPLSGVTLILYLIQRGFAAMSKAGVAGVDLKFGMGVFFTSVAVSAVAFGLLADRVKASWLMWAATVAGTIGILSGSSNMWVFGIGAGIAGAAIKILAFSVPLKNKTTDIDAVRIAPQAACKNIGAGLFYLLLAGALKLIGFSTFVSMVAGVFAVFGISASMALRTIDYPLIAWRWSDVKLLLSGYKWYVYTAWYAVSGYVIYNCIPEIVPALKSLGNSKTEALALMGIMTLAVVPFRWIFAACGSLIGHWNMMILSLATLIASISFIPVNPMLGVPVFLAAMTVNTPNMWACGKDFFGLRLGTAMGMCFAISYIFIGLTFGKW